MRQTYCILNLTIRGSAISSEEKNMRKEFRALLVAVLMLSQLAVLPVTPGSPRQPKIQNEPKSQQALTKEVRHVLVMLPYYSVFDNLSYRVDGDKVLLEGQVVRASLKSDAEAAVKSVEGVATVVNNIDVLPPAPMDDQLRAALYRAIYGESSLSRYGYASVASIHIIVKNGNVTLEGVVDSDSDKNVANIRAKGVPNVFSVKNNLQVAGGGK
jgi:hyperosmotically inducible periplasmic protein